MYEIGITKITANGNLSELNNTLVVKKMITIIRANNKYCFLSFSPQVHI